MEFLNQVSEAVMSTKGRWMFKYLGEKFNQIGNHKIIGKGLTSYVFQFESQKSYAIKVIKPSVKYDKTLRANDYQSLLDLQGISSIPKLYNGINEKLIVMEYFEGQTLDQLYDKNPNLLFGLDDINIIRPLFEDILEIYKRGYIPHDLHNGNVMLTNNNEFKLIDLGFFEKGNDYRRPTFIVYLSSALQKHYDEVYKPKIYQIIKENTKKNK